MSWKDVRPEARLWTGDALAGLRTLPDASVQCCVTSPPYYGLRSYLPQEHADKALEVGAEETPDAYVARLVEVFREVRRVLRDDGVLFMNLGDSYYGAGQRGSQFGTKAVQPLLADKANAERGHRRGTPHPIHGLKFKDLIGIPWMVAFALRADGWYLRQDIIWAKKNCMPESVTDRCTKSHEYVFLLAKRERYFFDADAIREKALNTPGGRLTGSKHVSFADGSAQSGTTIDKAGVVEFRNRRSVWTLSTESCAEAHFAVMPSALADLCIRAGTSERGACAACGAPWRRRLADRDDVGAVDCEGKWQGEAAQSSGRRILARMNAARKAGAAHDAPFQGRATVGWEPSCGCVGTEQVPCTVIDPFTGSGTTGIVALRKDRRFVGCELNTEYAKMAARRIAAVDIQLALL